MSYELAEAIFATPAAMGRYVLALIAGLLVAAAWVDVRQRRIPNVLVFSGTAIALLLHIVLPDGQGFVSTQPGGLGLSVALQGLFLGLLLMLPFHLWFGLGAGDVKLVAMLGAFLGPFQVWPVILASAVAGGGIVLLLIVARGQVATYLLARFEHRFPAAGARLGQLAWPGSKDMTNAQLKSPHRLPYAVAISIGCLGYLLVIGHQSGVV